MKIEIQSLNFPLSLSQYRYIEERLHFALDGSSENIEQVEVWLSDIRLAAGDVLKRCMIQVQLKGDTMVVSESSDSGLQVALHRAARQASWKVLRSAGLQNGASTSHRSAMLARTAGPIAATAGAHP